VDIRIDRSRRSTRAGQNPSDHPDDAGTVEADHHGGVTSRHRKGNKTPRTRQPVVDDDV